MITKRNHNTSISQIILVLVASIFLNVELLFGQNATSSPYSRFGIGDLNSISFSRNLGMGGTEIGLDQPGFINYGNPAAYSALWFTTYEGGADFKQFEFKTNSAVHRAHTSSVSYFDFAFPIKPQKWSLGFGLLPYSKVGYSVTEQQTTEFNDPEIRTYDGSGGLNNFHIGSGLKLTKKLSFGVNVEYLFGVINNDRTVAFGSPYYINSALSSSTSIGWFHFKTGFQYHMDSLPIAKSDSIVMLEKKICDLKDSLKLMSKNSTDTIAVTAEQKNMLQLEIDSTKKIMDNVVVRRVKSDWHLVLGLIAAPAANLHARESTLARSFRYFSYASPESGVLARDTIINKEGEEGNVRLPLSLGFGFSFLKGTKWIFCSDFTWQQWSDFSFLGDKDSLVDSWKVSAGIQFTPNDRSTKSFLNIMQYRIGFHYEQSFLKLLGQNINDMGVSAGFGLPIRKAGTTLHFTIEAGQRGTLVKDLIQEKYLKFTFGFTINDRWFMKEKFD